MLDDNQVYMEMGLFCIVYTSVAYIGPFDEHYSDLELKRVFFLTRANVHCSVPKPF